MEKQKLPTIKLQGKDYAQVKDRVIYFNENNPNGSISCVIDLNDFTTEKGTVKTAHCVAVVIPDVSNPDRKFTGSSFGSLSTLKAYEKLETVAVGRALAFLGIGADGALASYEEVEDILK